MGLGTGLAIAGAAGLGFLGAQEQAEAASDAAAAQGQAARDAAQAQLDAARIQTDLARDVYGQQRADLEPWRQTGLQALNQLGVLYGFQPQQNVQGPLTDPSLSATAAREEEQRQQSLAQMREQLEGLQNQPQGFVRNAANAILGYDRQERLREQIAELESEAPPQSLEDMRAQLANIEGEGGAISGIRGGLRRQQDAERLRAQIAQAEQQQTQQTAEPQSLAQFMDRFRESPDYQFAMQEGQRALERSAAARGGLFSGGTGRELTRYGQGMATQNLSNYLNRLSSLAGVGQTATSQLGTAAGNLGQQAGSAAQQAGAARASGYRQAGQAQAQGILGAGQAQQGLYGSLGNLAGMYAGYQMFGG